jgi:RND family efflux transporter MFP subunit
MQAETSVVSLARDARDASALWAGLTTSAGLSQLCQSWLALQCRTLDARAGLVLWRQDDASFAPVAVWPAPTHDVTYLAPAARQALAEQRGLFVRAQVQGRVHVAYPLGSSDGAMVAVAVLDLFVETDEQLQRAMQGLHWGAGWLQSRVGTEEIATLGSALARARLANDAVAIVGEQPDAQGALIALVNEVAQRLGAERALVGVAKGGRVVLRAISSTASFDERTQAAAAVENLMEEALDQGESVSSPLPAGGAFRVNVAHEEHQLDASLASVFSALLPGRDGPIGVLTVEHSAASGPIDAGQAQLVEAVALLAGPLLEDKLELERWVAGRAPDFVQSNWAKLTGRGHGTFKAVATAVLLLLAVLAIAEQEFRVTARAVVEGAVQRAAVAPYEGYVATADVRAGQTVQAGDVLAVLDDRDLVLERARWSAGAEQAAQKYRDALARRERAEAVIQAAQMREAQAQLALVEEKLERSRITAPIAGLVVTGDLSQRLGTPVEPGETLFEIAPLDAYRVVIQVDERDIAYVRVGQAGRMVLTGRPGDPIPFKVGNVTAISEQQDGRNVFRVEAEVDTTVGDLRPGMEGVGKIVAGERSILWVWTHRLTDWLRLSLWRWLP